MASYVCGPLPLVSHLGAFLDPAAKTKRYYIAQEPKAWPSHSNISYTFLDGAPSDEQLELVTEAIAEYTSHANVNLIRSKDGDASANIRISFAAETHAWSAIGTDALMMPEATMNLGFLNSRSNVSHDDRAALTLHEFGHAFGLSHEWDHSKASLRGSREAVTQHKAAFESKDTSNFPKVDTTSIMMFFVPQLFTQNAPIPVNRSLSKSDKAWLTLHYPGKAGGSDEEAGILRSLEILEVPLEASSQILLGSTVSEMRFHYLEYVSSIWGDRLGAQALSGAIEQLKDKSDDLEPQSHVLRGKISGITPLVDHNKEDDLYDTVAAAVLNPQFHQVLANVVNQDVNGQPNTNPQNKSSIAEIQHNIFLTLLPQILGPLLGSVLPMVGASSAINPQALPDNVQRGIFDMITRVLKNPIFTNTVRDVATEVFNRKSGGDD